MKERLISFWHYSQANTLVSTLEYNSAEGAGGKFAGPYIRTILAETNLVELKLCEHWSNYIAKFSATFLVILRGYTGRGGQAGDQEDGAAGEEDDEMSHNEPLPSDDAGESVNNDHTYCVPK